MKKYIILCLLVLVCVPLMGCTSSGNQSVTDKYQPVDYGNGVVYFFDNNYNGFDDSTGNTIAYYLKNHPDLKIVAIGVDNTRGNANTRGWYVFFEGKP